MAGQNAPYCPVRNLGRGSDLESIHVKPRPPAPARGLPASQNRLHAASAIVQRLVRPLVAGSPSEGRRGGSLLYVCDRWLAASFSGLHRRRVGQPVVVAACRAGIPLSGFGPERLCYLGCLWRESLRAMIALRPTPCQGPPCLLTCAQTTPCGSPLP
jgi:hypothetical protein